MNKLQRFSICLLSISALIGLIRGIRMAFYGGDNSLLFPYPKEMMQASVFSTYSILGWIIFSLVGVFSVLAIGALLYRVRNYGYFLIVEGIFISFFTLTHLLYAGFSFIHLIFLPMCISMIIAGVMQTPREF